MRVGHTSFVIFALANLATSAAWAADGQPWQVAKATGEVLLTRNDRMTVSLSSKSELQAGDTIQTGPTGRVMLTRGEERIVVSPNTSIGVPAENPRYPSTITQRSGTILLEVERKNVQHFEVETPYLAAVVKGTMFRITVDHRGSKVDVLRGQVQVADFKTGQTALVAPGQAARVLANGFKGLMLSGRGRFGPVERGTPRTPSVQAAAQMPPRSAQAKATGGDAGKAPKSNSVERLSGSRARIGSALGDVRLDLHKVTKGLAHSSNSTRAQVGSDPRLSASAVANGFTSENLNASASSPGETGNTPNRGNVGSASAASSNGIGVGSSNSVAQGSNKKSDQASSDDSSSTGNGKGNNGNGNGNNGNGNGNGNNGNGNGNNGNGNGNGKSKGKNKG